MTIIVGFGNNLRGEDGFGVDVILELQNYNLPNTKLISTFQLTPELCLRLKEASKIIFIDAAFDLNENYKLACGLENSTQNSLSHHISIKTIISMIKELYKKDIEYEVFSMLTSNFDEIEDEKRYKKSIKSVSSFIRNS